MTDPTIVSECVQRFDGTGPRAEIKPTGDHLPLSRWVVECFDPAVPDVVAAAAWALGVECEMPVTWRYAFTHRGAVRKAHRWVRRQARLRAAVNTTPEVIAP